MSRKDTWNTSRRETLFSKGANPAINIRKGLLEEKVGCNLPKAHYDAVKHHIPAPLAPFVNVISDQFDAILEKEWRIAGDFLFQLEDLFMVFCPEKEFEEFTRIQKKCVPVLFDLEWLKII